MAENNRKRQLSEERAEAERIAEKAKEMKYRLLGFARAFEQNEDHDAATLLRDASDMIDHLLKLSKIS